MRAQKEGRGGTVFILNVSTRRGWVLSFTLLRLYSPEGAQIRIVQQAGWSSGPVWTGIERRISGFHGSVHHVDCSK